MPNLSEGAAAVEAPRRRPAVRLRARKRAVAIAQRIMDEITGSRLQPGAKLPGESTMIDDYQVARGTLRESLRFLELNGVVQIKPGPGGGPVFSRPDGQDLASTLGLLLQALGTRFESITEVRRAVEPEIAALAAERMSDETLAAIEASISEMEASIDDADRFLESNREFHELVAAASGNPLLSLLISSLHFITDGSTLGIAYPERQRQSVVAAHRAILERLRARDADGARAAMAQHTDEFERYMRRHYPHVATNLVRWRDIAP
jgi:DNA-binding FadR family transcriptional regulator